MQNEKEAVSGKTCFSILSQNKTTCLRSQCPHWINNPDGQNCVMISASNGPHTLQEIGKIYGLTRMRICQIEKGIYKKIKDECS